MTLGKRIEAAPVTVGLLSLCIALFIVAELNGDTHTNETLLRFGGVWRGKVWEGEYWRLVTSMFLHIGALHLVWNVFGGFGLCAQFEERLGKVRFLLLYLGSGVAGSALSIICQNAVSAGASGAMFGLIGGQLAIWAMGARDLRALLGQVEFQRQVRTIVIWFGVGVIAHFDNYAHFGGMVFGAAFIWSLEASPWRRGVPLVALFAIVALSVRPWPIIHPDARAGRDATEAMHRGDAHAALAAAKERPELLHIRVWAHTHLKELDTALAEADQLVAVDPRYASGFEMRAYLHLRLGHFQQAADDYTKYFELGGTNATAHADRAKAFKMLGRVEDAIGDLTIAVSMSRDGGPASCE